MYPIVEAATAAADVGGGKYCKGRMKEKEIKEEKQGKGGELKRVYNTQKKIIKSCQMGPWVYLHLLQNQSCHHLMSCPLLQ